MIFGETPVDEAVGAILAHSMRAGNVALKKGRILSDTDIAALRDAGIESVVAARLEPGQESCALSILIRRLGGAHLRRHISDAKGPDQAAWRQTYQW